MSLATMSDTLSLQTEQDIVLCRQMVRKLTQDLAFSLVDQTKLVTAASELARNTVVYGGGGVLQWTILRDGGKVGLRLRFADEGPGIPDIPQAMTDGWTSGAGLGLGLSGAKRLVNEFELDTKPGQGTCVTIARWK